MRYINVDDQYVSQILEANQKLQNTQGLNESAEVVVEEQHEEEVHACPLCESELDQPISEEAMQECVDYITAVLNEAQQLSEELEDEGYGEELYEADSDDDESDEDADAESDDGDGDEDEEEEN